MYKSKFTNQDYSKYSFLITGGAGFIGSHIVEYLLKFGAAKVRVLDNFLTGDPENVKLFQDNPRYEFIEGDICDRETCDKACEGIDFVSHQAALGSVPRSINNPEATHSVNVNGFVNIALAAKGQGVKRMVYASSSSVYGDSPVLPKKENQFGNPLSPYAVSKYTNELYANVFNRVYGFEILGLRYFNIFGPRQNPEGPYAAVIPLFIKYISDREPVYIDGDGSQTRDFTYVENAVQANLKALFSDKPEALGRVFNIAVGVNYSVNHLYQTIADQLGFEGKPVYRAARAGDIKNSLADISDAQKFLDYQPSVKFEEGINRTISHFKKQLVNT